MSHPYYRCYQTPWLCALVALLGCTGREDKDVASTEPQAGASQAGQPGSGGTSEPGYGGESGAAAHTGGRSSSAGGSGGRASVTEGGSSGAGPTATGGLGGADGSGGAGNSTASGGVGGRTTHTGGAGPTTGGRGSTESGGAGQTTGGAGSSQAGTGGSGDGTGGAQPSSDAARLAASLGKPSRFLIGLGATDERDIASQDIQIDIFERYLVSLGSGAWPEWNSPSGAYVDKIVGATADGLGAVPMFTLYQMATAGDGNISAVIGDAGMMSTYWAQTRLLFERLALYDKPALVNFEPDFWGYVTLQAPDGDPTRLRVVVSSNVDCADLPDDVTGFGRCLVRMARALAPKALVGFPPSDWGIGTSGMIAFMEQVGASDADFVVMQTLDGDAGCFEARANSKCQREGSGWYWDESNSTSPNFQDHLAEAKQYSDGLGVPIVWWQTPLGVVSSTPGGTTQHYRDNRVHYFLTHADELVAAGGLAAVFSAGDDEETNITTDGGQFKILSAEYFANPAALP
jgi:hypothetical protein